jgi:LPPG:FO 2-phospho-L-lactate transferase
MKVAALAGGVGAGKFLRGLVREVPPEAVTVIVNTGDDLTLHGLHVSPDLDSVTYWLSDLADRDRGWGRRDETFRVLEEVRRLGGEAWFSLGDLDLGTHLARTHWLHQGATLSEATDRIRTALGIRSAILPMSDQQVTTWIDAIDEESGGAVSIPFQVYWVARGARDEVKAVRFEGVDRARPAPGAEEAILDADVVVICPSNPVVSVGPILAVPGLRAAVEARQDVVVGVSPIVRGAPVAGMADRLMPAVGLEVSALGAANAYRGLLRGCVVYDRDAALASRIEDEVGMRVAVTDTIMTDDHAAERVARAALELAAG